MFRINAIVKFISLLLILAILTGFPLYAAAAAPDGSESAVTASAPDFSDLSAKYADLSQEEKAEILRRLGVLLGDPERGLMLDIKVRRSDASVFFTRLLGREQYVKDRAGTEFSTSRFPDAPEGMWYTPYISYCTSIGLIAGRTDGYYYPDDNISEKEFANVLLKILGYEYEVDYNWDTVYEFSYDVGLFDDPAYQTRSADNREYFRRDVCDQVFAVLSLEKKNSSILLIEELIENGAISEKVASDLGFDLSGLSRPGSYGDFGVDADIYEVYHLEADLLWVIFTKPVTFRDESLEICQTYDYSKTLTARVEEKTGRDMLLRTGEQIPDMDYTIDISNVLETDGTNAGMLSYDFSGYMPGAPNDTPSGLTSLVRDVDALPGPVNVISGGTAQNTPQNDGQDGVIGEVGQNGDAGQTPATQTPVKPSGSADGSADYFRLINAYTTASNELTVCFSHPISDTALNPAFYNIVQGSSILCSGSAGQISAELADGAANAVKLTLSGFSFAYGGQYRATVSGRLTSSYTARLNEGAEDSYSFTADNISARNDSFVVTSVETFSQYGIEIMFSQPLNAEVAKQIYNYMVVDQSGRKIDISSVNINPASSAGASSQSAETKTVRINLSQPLLTRQTCNITVVYTQNLAMSASIANQTYQFQYGGQTETAKKSTMVLTGAISNDPSSVELYFSQKLDPASAVIVSNYSVNGQFDSSNYTVTPVKVTYEPSLTPYMVRLYFASDRRFMKDRPYFARIGNSIRDEAMLNPDRTLEMQFYASNRDLPNPILKDAVIVGEGIVKLSFSKEILFDPIKISESNFMLSDAGGADGSSGAAAGLDSQLTPILVKYIDASTIILRFDNIDMARGYNAQFVTITDISGQYTTRYPEHGSSISLRNGRK